MLGRIPIVLFSSTTQEEKDGISTKVGTKSIDKLKEVLESEVPEKNNEQLHYELSACHHFFDNAEMENGRK